MNAVTLALVTHDGIGSALLDQARNILATDLAGAIVVEVGYDEALTAATLRATPDEADAGAGVLVLTDLPGATPSNLALEASEGRRSAVVTGLNLPMLIRAWNYRLRPLPDLAAIAAEGGRRAIEVMP